MAATGSTRHVIWNRKVLEGEHDVGILCLSLGWSPEHYRMSRSHRRRDWFQQFAQDAELDITPPWSYFFSSPSSYLSSLTPVAHPASSAISQSNVPPPRLDAFSLASGHKVASDLIGSASETVNRAMQRPLGTFANNAAITESSEPSTPGLSLPPLFIGLPGEPTLSAFWHDAQPWSTKSQLQNKLEHGTLRFANAIHREAAAVVGANHGEITWHVHESDDSTNAQGVAALNAIHTIDGKTHVVAVGELECFLTLKTLQLIIKRASEGRCEFEHSDGFRYVDGQGNFESLTPEDALVGRLLAYAQDEGANVAFLYGGVGMLIFERVQTDEERFEWKLWPEVIGHTSLRDAAIGEAGPDSLRTWLTNERIPPLVTSFTLPAIIIAIGEYAAKLHRSYEVQIPNRHKAKGEADIALAAETSEIAEKAADATRVKRRHTRSLTKSRQLANDETLSEQDLVRPLFGFVSSTGPFAAGARARVYGAWRAAPDGSADLASEALVYKTLLLTRKSREEPQIFEPFELELAVYEAAQVLQGRFLPRLVWVERDQVSSSNSNNASRPASLTHSGSTQGSSSVKRAKSLQRGRVRGIVLTDVGASLLQLTHLGCAHGTPLAAHLSSKLPTNLLPALRSFMRSTFADAHTAAEHVASLVDVALVALHERGVLHGDIAQRNICVQINDHGALQVSLIDFDRSNVMALDLPTSAQAFKYERAEARAGTCHSIKAAWPSLSEA